MPLIGIVLTFIGAAMLDFSADSCKPPMRALLLDVCNQKDQITGLNMYAISGGLGAASGYALTTVDWNGTFMSEICNVRKQIHNFKKKVA